MVKPDSLIYLRPGAGKDMDLVAPVGKHLRQETRIALRTTPLGVETIDD